MITSFSNIYQLALSASFFDGMTIVAGGKSSENLDFGIEVIVIIAAPITQ